MAEIKIINASGQAAGTLAAPDKLANSNAKMALVHQVAGR
jgi:ribosomal protein L4